MSCKIYNNNILVALKILLRKFVIHILSGFLYKREEKVGFQNQKREPREKGFEPTYSTQMKKYTYIQRAEIEINFYETSIYINTIITFIILLMTYIYIYLHVYRFIR